MAYTEDLTELIYSLEQATLMAKQIGPAVEETQLLRIHSSLHHAHHCLSVFLSSVSSAEPMQLEDAEEVEERNSAVEQVEERMRECFIKNKRVKRPLSPSVAAADDRRFRDDGFGFDVQTTKLRALDLIYQFHG